MRWGPLASRRRCSGALSWIAFAFTALLCGADRAAAQTTIALPECENGVPRHSVCEIKLRATGGYTNPYTQVSVAATFDLSGSAVSKSVHGFFDGTEADGTGAQRAVFRIRFNVTHSGTWSYSVQSTPADAGLTVAGGSFAAADAPGRGFLRRHGVNPARFIFDDNSRPFLWGQTYYQIVTNARHWRSQPTPPARPSWQEAIDNSRLGGLGKARMLVYPFGPPLPPYPDSQPFTNTSHTRLDVEHWRSLDQVVAYMNRSDVGMVSDLILFNDQPRTFARTGTPPAPDVAQDRRYVRYAVARYAAFPNVIWCLTNEWQLSKPPEPYAQEAYWNDKGAILRGEDPWSVQDGSSPPNVRPLSIHARNDHLFQFFDAAWPTYAVIQDGIRNGRACPGEVPKDPPHFDEPDKWGSYSICNNLGRGMPVANDEYGYIGDVKPTPCPQTAFPRQGHRRVAWGIATAGGFGSAGDARAYAAFNGQQAQPFFSGDWQPAAEYDDLRRMVAFMTTRVFNWWRLARDVSVVPGATGCTPPASRVYALSLPSVRYVVYAAGGGTVTLNLPPPLSGFTTYRVSRIDPRFDLPGSETPLGTVEGGTQSFTLPSAGDWLLLIEV